MVASDGKIDSSEMNIDLSNEEEKIISCEYGKFKISFTKEVVPINIIFPCWTCNILLLIINKLFIKIYQNINVN